ncbi:MAG TPA: type II toxin-antitoxin system Phd/YefM family antitoxin [Mobilitalea sp.]|nr:type II toxin-antitoxin system Phd/YefM family antitoxin [Mobilitalea sp.]
MPVIRPITDLRNKSNEIEELCNSSQEPVFITKNGIGELAVMSIEVYERMQARLELYSKLAEIEKDIDEGDEGRDFVEFANELRSKVNGSV